MSKAAIHGSLKIEYTLCGIALDAYETGDHHEPVIDAKDGQTVTCQECRNHIDYIRQRFTRYRYKEEKQP